MFKVDNTPSETASSRRNSLCALSAGNPRSSSFLSSRVLGSEYTEGRKKERDSLQRERLKSTAATNEWHFQERESSSTR